MNAYFSITFYFDDYKLKKRKTNMLQHKLSEHVQNCIKQTFTFVGLAFDELNYKLKHA